MLAGILIVVGTAAVGVVVLALLSLRLWRQVRALGQCVGQSSRRLDEASAALDSLATRPPGTGGPADPFAAHRAGGPADLFAIRPVGGPA